MKIGCVILASGYGRRFGGNKLLCDLGGKKLVSYALEAAAFGEKKDWWERPILVSRYPEVLAIGDSFKAISVKNDYPDQSDSVRLGLSAPSAEGVRRSDEWAGCIFMTADQPFIKPETLHRMTSAFRSDPDIPCRISYKDMDASPVLFPASFFPKLLTLSGDHGGGFLLKDESLKVNRIEAEDGMELFDIDDGNDLIMAEEYLKSKAGCQ